MNEFMVAKWNEKVKSRDEVFVLGDFSFGNVEETTKISDLLKENQELAKKVEEILDMQ